MTSAGAEAAHGALALRLLADLAAHGPQAPPVAGDHSEECLEWLAGRQVDSLLYLREPQPPVAQRAYERVWAAQRAALLVILGALDTAGVTVVVIKGAELFERCFGGRCVNLLSDVDLLVGRDDVPAARDALRSLGFRQAGFDRTTGTLVEIPTDELARLEAGHYELAPFTRLDSLALDEEETAVARAHASRHPSSPVGFDGDEPVLALTVDLHHGLATNVDGAELIPAAVPSAFGTALTLAPADHVWLTATRLYTEVATTRKRSLRDLAYLTMLVRDDGVDWERVLDAHRRLRLWASLYYYLAFVDRLTGSVPEAVLEEVCPLRGPRVLDWGWQLSPLFATLDPFPLDLAAPNA